MKVRLNKKKPLLITENKQREGITEKSKEKKQVGMLNEEVLNYQGEKVSRIKSSYFYLLGVLTLAIGIVLTIYNNLFGLVFILFLSPTLFLYPLVRFFLGGKDSQFAFITTSILSTYLKYIAVRGKKEK